MQILSIYWSEDVSLDSLQTINNVADTKNQLLAFFILYRCVCLHLHFFLLLISDIHIHRQ